MPSIIDVCQAVSGGFENVDTTPDGHLTGFTSHLGRDDVAADILISICWDWSECIWCSIIVTRQRTCHLFRTATKRRQHMPVLRRYSISSSRLETLLNNSLCAFWLYWSVWTCCVDGRQMERSLDAATAGRRRSSASSYKHYVADGWASFTYRALRRSCPRAQRIRRSSSFILVWLQSESEGILELLRGRTDCWPDYVHSSRESV